jgi:hypothetical protein
MMPNYGGFRAMPFEDNKIDIDHLKKVELTRSDFRALVTVLDAISTGLILPLEAAVALDKLKEIVEPK